MQRATLAKRERPVEALAPFAGGYASLHGALRHMTRPVPGADIAEPTGEVWEAERV